MSVIKVIKVLHSYSPGHVNRHALLDGSWDSLVAITLAHHSYNLNKFFIFTNIVIIRVVGCTWAIIASCESCIDSAETAHNCYKLVSTNDEYADSKVVYFSDWLIENYLTSVRYTMCMGWWPGLADWATTCMWIIHAHQVYVTSHAVMLYILSHKSIHIYMCVYTSSSFLLTLFYSDSLPPCSYMYV